MTILSKLIRLILAHIGNKNQSWSNPPPPPHTHTHTQTHSHNRVPFSGAGRGDTGLKLSVQPPYTDLVPPFPYAIKLEPMRHSPPLGKLSPPLGGYHSPYKKPEKETLLSWHLGEASLKRNEKFRDKIRDGLGWY